MPALGRLVCASCQPDYRKTGFKATVSDMPTFQSRFDVPRMGFKELSCPVAF